MAEKTLFSNDAEVAILSIILNNPDSVHEVDGLRYFMFSSIPHQNLYLEIEGMVERQVPTEPSLIIAEMEASGTISKIGGKKYIEQLVNYSYNKETICDYREIIIKSYKARSLISLGASVSTVDKVNIDNVDEQIGKIKKSLDTLLEFRGGLQTAHVGDSVMGVYTEIVARSENPNGIAGVSWGIKNLDDATGGKVAGDLIVVGGRPGMAKTALILNSILADAKAGVPSLLFEKEMRTQQLVERMISIESGIPITNIRLGILTKPQVSAIFDTLSDIKKLPIYIDTSYRISDPYYIESTINKYHNIHGIKNVYLDYIGLLVERDDNQVNEIGRFSRLFKSLSNELDICSILVSQLNRGVEMRENKRPMMSDLRQSGNLEEDADLVIGLYRDEYYNKESRYKGLMEALILKNRNGPPGVVSLRFDDPTNRISAV
jgi:replicative DNA helicase